MMSKEGDHERGTYTMKTGFRPDPTVIHPSIGAILCHELPEGRTDVPRHVAILPGRWSGAAASWATNTTLSKCSIPEDPVPDMTPRVPTKRDEERRRGSRRG